MDKDGLIPMASRRLFPRTLQGEHPSLEQENSGTGLDAESGWSGSGILSMIDDRMLKRSIEVEYPLVFFENCPHSWNDLYEGIQNAKDVLEEGFDEYGELERRVLSRAGYVIVPTNRFGMNMRTGFRTVDANIQGFSKHAPNPGVVSREIERLLYDVSTLENGLQKGIYSHLHLIRIQPFPDGNKRIARLAERAYFGQEGLLAPLIVPDVRSEYLNALDDSIGRYRDGDEEYLKGFSEFVVSQMDQSKKHFRSVLDTEF